jgi:putative transposase
MPDHFHILITPSVTLERAIQYIKGGFSFRVKKNLHSSMEISQTGFSDHRVRDTQDYRIHVDYIYRNPPGRNMVGHAAEYPYCSAFPDSLKDEVPQWLKPMTRSRLNGAPEGAPLQIAQGDGAVKASPIRHSKVLLHNKGLVTKN